MGEQQLAWLMMAVGTVMILALVAMLTTLDNPDLSKPKARPSTDEGRCSFLAAAQKVGVKIMSVVDEALARLTTFVKNVATQLVVARQTNAVQTGKLNELQVALETALSDDAADKAKIAALQAEILDLQNAVAAQINTVVDALENPPLQAPVEETPVVDEVAEEAVVEEVVVDEVVEETPVDEVVEEVVVEEEVPVAEDTVVPVDGSGDAPVE